MSFAGLLPSGEPSGSLPQALLPLIGLVLVWLAVWLWIRRFLARNLTSLPREHWHVQPWTSWFLLLPPVNLVWNFYFLLGLSHVYSKTFKALGRQLPARESGRTEAIIYSVAFCTGWYPMGQGLLALLWMGGLVALIIYLFKIHSLAERFARIRLDS